MSRTFGPVPRLAALSVAMTLLTSTVASAQSTNTALPAGAPTQIELLSAPAFARRVQGKTVWITTSDGTRRKVVVKAIPPTGIVISGGPSYVLSSDRKPVLVHSQAMTIPLDQIDRIDEVSHRLRNGIVGGFFAGIGVGFGYLAANDCFSGPECAGGFWGLTGLGVGVGVAAALALNANKDRDLLYDVKRRTTTMAFAPVLSPTRKGMAFSMTWR